GFRHRLRAHERQLPHQRDRADVLPGAVHARPRGTRLGDRRDPADPGDADPHLPGAPLPEGAGPMSAVVDAPRVAKKSKRQPSYMKDGRPRSWTSIIVMVVLAFLWSVPTLGLLVSSFRSREAVSTSGWWTALFNPVEQGWTLDNYAGVLEGSNMAMGFLNTRVVSIPATILPSMFAAFAAYAFTFMEFPGREILFVVIVAGMVVPIQVALQPLLYLLGPYGIGISGQFVAIWLLHTGFGMPLCLYT